MVAAEYPVIRVLFMQKGVSKKTIIFLYIYHTLSHTVEIEREAGSDNEVASGCQPLCARQVSMSPRRTPEEQWRGRGIRPAVAFWSSGLTGPYRARWDPLPPPLGLRAVTVCGFSEGPSPAHQLSIGP